MEIPQELHDGLIAILSVVFPEAAAGQIVGWGLIGSALVLLANVVTSLTPTRWDDRAVDIIFRVLNVIAFNAGKNRNLDDVEPTRLPKPPRVGKS